MKIIVPDEYAGRPLRDFLRREAGVSAKLLARLKRDESGILLRGERVTVRHILEGGDIVILKDYAGEKGAPIDPVELPLEIVYEDEYLLVADKPPNMPTHPSRDHRGDTLANALAHRCRNSEIPFVFRPVSRLDRNTSGLLTVAKTKYAAARLGGMMKRGEFDKRYVALLDGPLSEPRGVIDAPLHRTAASIITREVCQRDAPDAEAAATLYEVLLTGGGYTLVLAAPLTGRTHQLRVHFAHAGAPILGDDLYGRASALIGRQALHAAGLKFTHPVSGAPVELISMPPPDISGLIGELFGEDARRIIRNSLEVNLSGALWRRENFII